MVGAGALCRIVQVQLVAGELGDLPESPLAPAAGELLEEAPRPFRSSGVPVRAASRAHRTRAASMRAMINTETAAITCLRVCPLTPNAPSNNPSFISQTLARA